MTEAGAGLASKPAQSKTGASLDAATWKLAGTADRPGRTCSGAGTVTSSAASRRGPALGSGIDDGVSTPVLLRSRAGRDGWGASVGRRRSCRPASLCSVVAGHLRLRPGRLWGRRRALPPGAGSPLPSSARRNVSTRRVPSPSGAVEAGCPSRESSRSPGGLGSCAPGVPRVVASISPVKPHALSTPSAIQTAGRPRRIAGQSPDRSGRADRSRSSSAAARWTVSIWSSSRPSRAGFRTRVRVMLASSMSRPSCFRSDGRSVACLRSGPGRPGAIPRAGAARSFPARAPSGSSRSARARRSRTGGREP